MDGAGRVAYPSSRYVEYTDCSLIHVCFILIFRSEGGLMFVNAIETAIQFTRPVVISHRNVKGECFSAIGSFIMINKEGWATTAAHITNMSQTQADAAKAYKDADTKRKEIHSLNLDKKERTKRLKLLPSFDANSPTNASTWWSWNNLQPTQIVILPYVDLAFVKFDAFDSALIKTYPVFKNPSKNIKAGKSLCRIGFPFSTITPTFDAAKDLFILPPGAIPLPFFPNEGIFTRTVLINPEPPLANPPSYKLMYLETSSAGLRGQSGGPIFDCEGNVWAIQSQTRHFPLGFSPDVPNSKHGEKEHQFMNIGWGIHIETIVGAMTDLGISFNTSNN